MLVTLQDYKKRCGLLVAQVLFNSKWNKNWTALSFEQFGAVPAASGLPSA